MRNKSMLAALFVAVLMIFAACGDTTVEDVQEQAEETAEEAGQQAEETAEEARRQAEEAVGRPTVEITSPTDDSTVEGDVTVEVEASNFEVVDKLGEPAVEGEGHVHFYRDVPQDEIPTDADQPAVTQDQDTYHATAARSHTWTGVASGEHVFCVQLVDNDHTALEQTAVDCATVTVQ